MFSPRYSGSQMWCFLTSPAPASTKTTPRLSAFDEKQQELDTLKKSISAHLRDLDRLHIAYMDWFKLRIKDLLSEIQQVQFRLPTIVPQQIGCMADFIKILEFAERLKNSGKPLAKHHLLEDFRRFWNRLNELRHYENRTIHPGICEFCESVTKLRHPEVKEHVDNLHQRINKELSVEFNFNDLHNERDNLFTYNIGPGQHAYLGLVQYIPYVLQCARKMCYVALKLHVEVE